MIVNANGNNSLAYNNFREMPKIPYMIFEKLATSTSQSAENLFKALKYATVDCLSQPNLTLLEKVGLLWTPNISASEQANYNIFLKPLMPNAVDTAEQQQQLRIYRYITKPTNRLEAVMAYSFDIYTQEATCMLIDETDTMVERTDYIEACLLDVLNGTDLQVGSSFFSFCTVDNMSSNTINSLLTISNSKSFYGRTLKLALRYVNAGVGGACGG